MARNIEIKAPIGSTADFEERVSRLADAPPRRIEQDDTFFECGEGRLKLRSFGDGSGELIYYRRANGAGPKICVYQVSPTDDAESLRRVLREAFGEVGRVRKQRTLYMVGRTRVHIDQVEGLGDFVELEVVLSEGEGEDSGTREARELMAALGIDESALIERAYVDLLNERSD